MTAPTSRTGISSPSRGFSLLELLVALSILAVIAALVAPAFAKALEGAQFDTATRNVINGLRQARRLAINENREAVFSLDTASGEAWVNDEAVRIDAPAATAFALTIAASEQTVATAGNIRFFADGSSTGGTIALRNDGKARKVSVDWLTGTVEFAE